MKNQNTALQTVDQIVTDGVRRGILHLYTDETSITGNVISLKGRPVVNFGSCSYLGLEFDPRLIEGSVTATRQFGTQFSESRAYVSVSPYSQLEEKLRRVFGLPVVITPTTTLGHFSAIPTLVGDNDAVLLDHQVHNSIQMAVNMVKARGVHVELVRHNRIDVLEEKIMALRKNHDRIWYMADGIYSMFGDKCPVKQVEVLLDRYPELFFYIDDAHGTSIYGDRGQGYVLTELPHHPKMVVAASLNKAFACGGGVIIFPDEEMARRVRTCGGPLITSGPMQPSALGAGLACADIHLSGEIKEMQEDLHANIQYANLLLKKYRLPVISESDAAVFFIGVSLPGLGYNMIQRMLDQGYYLNLGIFPAVPMKNTGVRFTITRLHTFTQIEAMIRTFHEQFAAAMAEEGVRLEDIYKAFRMPVPEEATLDKMVASVVNQSLHLRTFHYRTIKDVSASEWDALFLGRGSFDYCGLQFLEHTFRGNRKEEENWLFDYVLIKDNDGQPVVATFLTTTLYKDDMLSPAAVSEIVEEKRLKNPYYLTSRVIATGSLLTEGSHIYINRSSAMWKDAMVMLFEKITELQGDYEANTVMLRDFTDADEELRTFLIDQGFFGINMPDTNIVSDICWNDEETFYRQLSHRSRQHLRQDVLKHKDDFILREVSNPAKEEIRQWQKLYEQVRQRNLSLNTFPLPEKLFSEMARHEGWDITTLHLRKGHDEMAPHQSMIAVMFCYRSEHTYSPMILGMDYEYLQTLKCYKQVLYRMMLRARQLGCTRVQLGFSAATEKKKVGAVQVPTWAFVQVKDNFNLQELGNITVTRQLVKTR
jgi:7-keto-8-aminopelargonate synthetase-like enzyme